MKSAFYGTDGNLQYLSGFAILHALIINQLDNRMHRFRQLFQRAANATISLGYVLAIKYASRSCSSGSNAPNT